MNNNLKSDLQPLITIIIATYNELFNIQKTLDSIYHQKYVNIEIIVIDGDSDDGTVDILNENSARISYWISEVDIGIYDAWNKALKQSSGDWIMFLGAGDCLKFNALDHYIGCINSSNGSENFISSKGTIIDSKGKDIRDDIGDMMVVLINIMVRNNLTMKECLSVAYDDIKDRKGKMVDGIFIKEGDE